MTWINWSAFLAQRKCKFQSWEHLEPFLLEVMGFLFPWPQCWLCQIESYCNHRQPSGSWGWTRSRKNPQTSKRWFFFSPRYYQEIVGREEEYATELLGRRKKSKDATYSKAALTWEQLLKWMSLLSVTHTGMWPPHTWLVFFCFVLFSSSHRKNTVICSAESSSLKCFLKLIKPRHMNRPRHRIAEVIYC